MSLIREAGECEVCGGTQSYHECVSLLSFPINLWTDFFSLSLSSVNKVPDLKGFLVSFTSGEALTIQFFGELSSCNGNLPKGKAGVRRGINKHWGHIQA